MPNNQKAFQLQKIILAAQKLMYSEGTSGAFMQELQKQGSPDDVASDTAMHIMMILISESKLQIDPELVMPAGVTIVGDILDLMEQSMGMKHDEEMVMNAIEKFVQKMKASVSGEEPGEIEGKEMPGMKDESEEEMGEMEGKEPMGMNDEQEKGGLLQGMMR